MNICLVYDRVNKIGGAERVLTSLHHIWPNAPLYTSVYDPSRAPWAKSFQVISSFINRLPGAKRHHELLASGMPYAFESFDLSSFDVVISVTSAEAKGVLTNPNQLHICYLLTPTRYLWSHTEEYAGHGPLGWLRSQFMKPLRRWDTVAASRPDKMIAISKAVADRCQKYYHRSVDTVIYPPVNTRYFSPSKQSKSYFLIVSRLVPYKQVDLAIKACNHTKDNLVIVGTGSEMQKLKKIAGPSITFTGHVTDEKLRDIYAGAKGFLFPQEEEFGISAVEAMAAGVPVIAFNKGSAKEIIIPGKTGVLFDKQTVSSLVAAITTFNDHTWYDKTIQEHAQQFSESVFQKQIHQFVEESWKHQINQK